MPGVQKGTAPVQLAQEAEVAGKTAEIASKVEGEAIKAGAKIEAAAAKVETAPAAVGKTKPVAQEGIAPAVKTELAKDASIANRYSGELVKVPKPDAQAEKLLAQRFKDGQTCIKFKNDPNGKEFDIITKEFIVETKPAMRKIGSPFREQAKRAFEAAKQTDRKVYFHFDGEPCSDIINKLNKYQQRYGIEMVIDTKPLD